MGIPGGKNFESILVVEDEPSIMKLCRKTLSSEGFEVDIAVNGKVAQEMVNNKQYVLCLVDIRTPEMNGMEFYEWLWEIHPEMAKKVIFTTGDIIGKDTIIFIEQSKMPFLPKPFTPRELQLIVGYNLNYSKMAEDTIKEYYLSGYDKNSLFKPSVSRVLYRSKTLGL